MDELFIWARQAGPHSSWEEFEDRALAALQELPSANPLTRELTRLLAADSVDWRRINQWPLCYRYMRGEQELLLEELYDYAAGLSLSSCQTSRFRRFRRQRGRPEVLSKIRLEIENCWENYSSQPLGRGERTAETVAGHRLLVEGLALWLDALAVAEEDPADERALELAVEANRLLLAVQYLSHRVSIAAANQPTSSF